MVQKSKSAQSKARPEFRFLGGLLVLIPLTAVIWLVMHQASKATRQPSAEHEVTAAPPALQPHGSESAQPVAPEPKAAPEKHSPDVTLAKSEPENKPGDPSHPMSPDRMRAYHQDFIIGQIDGAILVKDYEGIRRLNEQYRHEYPDDDQMTREAYDMIADCFEKKTPELVQRARTFWETKRGSRARRQLRHACLE